MKPAVKEWGYFSSGSDSSPENSKIPINIHLPQNLGRGPHPLNTWNPNDPGFDWKKPCFVGLTFKNRGHLGSRYVHKYLANRFMDSFSS